MIRIWDTHFNKMYGVAEGGLPANRTPSSKTWRRQGDPDFILYTNDCKIVSGHIPISIGNRKFVRICQMEPLKVPAGIPPVGSAASFGEIRKTDDKHVSQFAIRP